MSPLSSFEWRTLPGLSLAALRASWRMVWPKGRDDRWLDRWLPLVQQCAHGLPVLELGCGAGDDSQVLVDAGLKLVAIDLSASQVAKARARVPSADFHCQDLRAAFPIARTGVIVASLSLHYFDWAQTLVLFQRIHDALLPGGVLLCRLNSTRDIHFGARGHAPIERHYFMVHGEPKRFFDEADIREALAGWRVVSLQEKATHRYVLPKTVWEVIARRED